MVDPARSDVMRNPGAAGSVFRSDVARATLSGLVVAGLLVAGIWFGSRGLRDFDTALVPYAGASVFCAFGLGYRYGMWLRRPPTRMYWRRGWMLFLRPRDLPRNLVDLVGIVWKNFAAQRFIEKRSTLRWSAHLLLAWGCVLAAAVTFPLSFGWVRFETERASQEVYRAFVFGIHVGSFRLDGPVAPLAFNVLVIASFMVIGGVCLALWRRARDRGALAVQQFASDLLPLILLFAVSATGLLLTVSTHFLRGFHYGFLSQFHAVTVIFTLLYLPFGKLFHVFQRPAQLSLDYYRREGEEGGRAPCTGCGEPFATRLHVEDLKSVEADLGIRFGGDDGAHYQDVCPTCRRKGLALAQDRLWRGARRPGEG